MKARFRAADHCGMEVTRQAHGVVNEHVDLLGADGHAGHAADPAEEEHGNEPMRRNPARPTGRCEAIRTNLF
jgi:hypothetical protein